MALTLRMPGRTFGSVDPAIPLSDVRDLDLRDEARVVHELELRHMASYEEGRRLRECDWRINWEYRYGNQYVYWNRELNDLMPLPVPEELRMVENQITGMVRQAVNQMVQGDPAWDAMALSRDWDARESARMAKPLLFSYAREFKLGRLRALIAADCITFGFGVKKTYWNPGAGGIISDAVMQVDEETGEELDYPVTNITTGQPRVRAFRYAGKMQQCAKSPWLFFPQPGLEGPSLDDADFCFDGDWVSPAWILSAYGVDVEKDVAERQETMPFFLSQPGDFGNSMFNPGLSANRRSPSGKVLMRTYYQKPAPKRGFDRGLEIRWCGTRMLGKPLPLQTCPEKPDPVTGFDAPLPFTIYAAEERRCTFYPHPPLSDWRGPQDRINQTLSHQYGHAEMAAYPTLLTTKGDGIPDPARMAGEKWEMPPGVPDPRFLTAPPVPPWLFQMKGDATGALDRVAMSFAPGRGERMRGDPSGLYIDILRENDTLDLAAIVRDHAAAHEAEGGMLLRLAKIHEPEERMLQIIGRNGKGRVFRFRRDALQPEKVRVYVQSTSLLPFLSASRQRAVVEMYEKGVFAAPPPVRKALLAYINAPGLFELDDLDAEDDRYAERLHSMIIDEGMRPLPSSPPEGTPPEMAQMFMQQIAAAVQGGKAFVVDQDVDPNIYLPLALSRKKEDDYVDWPDERKQYFAEYIGQLKLIQQMHTKVMMEAQAAQQKAAMDAAMAMEDHKQEAQADGRGKVKAVQVAGDLQKIALEASLAPTPDESASAKAKADIVTAFAEAQFQAAIEKDKETAGSSQTFFNNRPRPG